MVSNGYNFMWFQLVYKHQVECGEPVTLSPKYLLHTGRCTCFDSNEPPKVNGLIQRESFGGNDGRDGFSPRTYTNMCSVSVQEQAGKSKRSHWITQGFFLWFKIDGPSRRRFVFSIKFPERICAKPFVWTSQLRCIHICIYIYTYTISK